MTRIKSLIPAAMVSVVSLYHPTVTRGFVATPTTRMIHQRGILSNHPDHNFFREKISCSETLFAERSTSESSGARVRFSGTEGLTSTTTNPLDAFLTLLASDIASIVLGLVGLFVIVAHRVSLLDDTSADTLTVQTRTDLLAVFACGSVLLDGITKLDITSAMAESVVLEGITLQHPENYKDILNEDESTVVWALGALLTATPAMTAVVLERGAESSQWQVLARSGTVPPAINMPESTPILDRVSGPGNSKETYLPTLQALPGKREFPYLPSNAQLALLLPIRAVDTGSASATRVLVLGSNQAKSFTPRDVAWCRIVAERIANKSSS